MANISYNQGKSDAWTADIDGATMKIAFLDSNYSPDKDADHFWSDISANEVSGTGYTAGGFALDNVAGSIDDTNDRGVLDADNEAPSGLTVNDVRYFVIYRDTGTASTSALHFLLDPAETISVVAGTLTVQFHADGIAYIGE